MMDQVEQPSGLRHCIKATFIGLNQVRSAVTDKAAFTVQLLVAVTVAEGYIGHCKIIGKISVFSATDCASRWSQPAWMILEGFYPGKKWRAIERTNWAKDQASERDDQCDQIWRNFATLAKVYKSLANFYWFISFLAKWWAYFGKFVTLLG